MLKFYLYVNEELFMEMVKNIFKTEPLGWILSLAAVGLIIAGFVVPPLGIIDGSVLTGTGIIFAFFALDKLPSIINSISEGKQLTISHGNTNVNITSREGEEK